MIDVTDVLKQVRHLWKRAPFSVLGNAFFPFPTDLRNVVFGFHSSKLRDTKLRIQSWDPTTKALKSQAGGKLIDKNARVVKWQTRQT
jgi:hypothetical protein